MGGNDDVIIIKGLKEALDVPIVKRVKLGHVLLCTHVLVFLIGLAIAA